MTSPLNPPTSHQELRTGAKALSTMASLSIAAGEMHAAEAYILEMLAWCAFADRAVACAYDDDRESYARAA